MPKQNNRIQHTQAKAKMYVHRNREHTCTETTTKTLEACITKTNENEKGIYTLLKYKRKKRANTHQANERNFNWQTELTMTKTLYTCKRSKERASERTMCKKE